MFYIWVITTFRFKWIYFSPLQVVSEMQKTETKNSKAKDIFEKVKTDVRLMKEELTTIERNQVHYVYLQKSNY